MASRGLFDDSCTEVLVDVEVCCFATFRTDGRVFTEYADRTAACTDHSHRYFGCETERGPNPISRKIP